MPIAALLKLAVVAAVAAAGALMLAALSGITRADPPWATLDLGEPGGARASAKLGALGGDLSACRALLDRAGIAHVTVPARREGASCGYTDGVRTRTEGPLAIAFRPPVIASCPVAATLAMWEWHVVQPAAERHFGRPVTAIEDFGTYSCRRVGGATSGSGWSEHARANAIDIAGFRLEGGRHITIVGNWEDSGPTGRFLREVRDGACDLFATTLSPDYNAAHRDHLHLDQARRGTGWQACR